MSLNPVISTLGRRLRLAVIGGGPGSFIGAMHRQSARLDDRYDIVTGILSSVAEKSKQAANELGFASYRQYANVTEMLDAEVARKDGIDAVAIMTPNDSHYDYSIAALEHGVVDAAILFRRGVREPNHVEFVGESFEAEITQLLEFLTPVTRGLRSGLLWLVP